MLTLTLEANRSVSDGAVTERCRGEDASGDKGGCDRGRFGPGAATVSIRSSGLSSDPQRPGGGGGGGTESTDRCAAVAQPSGKHPLWLRRRQARSGPWLPQLGGAVLSPARSRGDHAD